MSECRHLRAGLFTSEGADHHGIDLFVKCPECGKRGPHIECLKASDKLGRLAWRAWNGEVSHD